MEKYMAADERVEMNIGAKKDSDSSKGIASDTNDDESGSVITRIAQLLPPLQVPAVAHIVYSATMQGESLVETAARKICPTAALADRR